LSPLVDDDVAPVRDAAGARTLPVTGVMGEVSSTLSVTAVITRLRIIG
jgi:hypothetical protein